VDDLNSMDIEEDKLLSKKEVAKMLNVSLETVRRLAIMHNMRVVRLNANVVRYPLSEVRKLISERTR
jgi:excisionase family DNA binding protein